MTAKRLNFKLLTTLIVAVLHPNESQPIGTVWSPDSAPDIHEAEQLVRLGYAELTDEKPASAITEQEPEKDDPEQPLHDILALSAADAENELVTLTPEQLVRITELETAGKGRKGLLKAIASLQA